MTVDINISSSTPKETDAHRQSILLQAEERALLHNTAPTHELVTMYAEMERLLRTTDSALRSFTVQATESMSPWSTVEVEQEAAASIHADRHVVAASLSAAVSSLFELGPLLQEASETHSPELGRMLARIQRQAKIIREQNVLLRVRDRSADVQRLTSQLLGYRDREQGMRRAIRDLQSQLRDLSAAHSKLLKERTAARNQARIRAQQSATAKREAEAAAKAARDNEIARREAEYQRFVRAAYAHPQPSGHIPRRRHRRHNPFP